MPLVHLVNQDSVHWGLQLANGPGPLPVTPCVYLLYFLPYVCSIAGNCLRLVHYLHSVVASSSGHLLIHPP
jgi:hypothetical protein